MLSLSSVVLRPISAEEYPIVGAVGVAAIVVAITIYSALISKDKDHEFPKLRGLQLYHAWNFIQRRYDFLRSNFNRNPGMGFSFNVLHHNVVALTGEGARQVFFSNPHFDITEGYKIFTGATPRLDDVTVITEEIKEENASPLVKKLTKLLSKDRLQNVLPALLQDINDEANKWGNGGKSGRIDPFTEIYHVVFHMIARVSTCDDLAKNDADLRRIEELFMTHQTSTTAASLLFRWFPSPSMRARKEATTELYTMLYTYVETRRHAAPTSDLIDVLIAEGEDTQKIVGFVIGILMVGVISTGITSCWLLIDLGVHREWRERCRKEIEDFISRHLGHSPFSAMRYEELGAISTSAWEDELPTVDACIRETLRISMNFVALRRNVHEDTKIGGKVVRRGNFLAYPIGEVHLNPEYYPEPYRYNPGRWLEPDRGPSSAYPFLAWGAGRHPCTGSKLAKIEMKLLLAVFLTRYEYELVDKDGKFPDPLPVPDRNDIHQARPLGATCYLDFKEIVR